MMARVKDRLTKRGNTIVLKSRHPLRRVLAAILHPRSPVTTRWPHTSGFYLRIYWTSLQPSCRISQSSYASLIHVQVCMRQVFAI